MWDTERTIDAIAVFERRRFAHVPLIIVAVDAHIVSSKAMVSGLSTAEHALPVNLLITVFLTCCLASANVFKQAGLAKQVFGLGLVLLGIVHFLLTVDETPEVRLLAAVTLVEGAPVVSIFLRFLVIDVVNVLQAFIVEDALISRISQSLSLHDFFESKQGAKLLRNRF